MARCLVSRSRLLGCSVVGSGVGRRTNPGGLGVRTATAGRRKGLVGSGMVAGTGDGEEERGLRRQEVGALPSHLPSNIVPATWSRLRLGAAGSGLSSSPHRTVAECLNWPGQSAIRLLARRVLGFQGGSEKSKLGAQLSKVGWYCGRRGLVGFVSRTKCSADPFWTRIWAAPPCCCPGPSLGWFVAESQFLRCHRRQTAPLCAACSAHKNTR
jgi:hypothetical protein